MRIVDEWTHENIRLTLFHMNGRYSLKLEKDLREQTYKFRDGQFENPSDLKNKLNDEFFEVVNNIFLQQNQNRENLDSNSLDSEFDTII